MQPAENHSLDGSEGRVLSRGDSLPAVLRSVSFEIPGGTPAPGVARHCVLEGLGEVLAEEERSNLALLISELVTNSVKHAGMVNETDVIRVHAAVAPDRTRIEVCDTGAGFTPGQPQVRSFESGGGGLGLVLLDRLSATWGVTVEEDVCVWAELERAGEPDR
jgi:anti-sigma regulatory factor (Ser/Thr protein kinase)